MVGKMTVSQETVRCWTVTAYITHGGDRANISAMDNRIGKQYKAEGFRFPIGWRSGDIDRLPVPKYVQAAPRRVMNNLI